MVAKILNFYRKWRERFPAALRETKIFSSITDYKNEIIFLAQE
jgi:hypothetical protein